MVETASFFSETRTAFVAIDLQRGIVGRNVAPHSGEKVVERAAQLAAAFRNAKLPVVWVHVTFRPGEMVQPLLDEPPQMPAPAPGWDELVPELGVSGDDLIVTKRNWGAFYGTDLDLHLRRRGVGGIALCGISTNIGVESTARDAFERNYKLLFVEDAMAASSQEEHAYSCRTIFPRLGLIRTASQTIEALRP